MDSRERMSIATRLGQPDRPPVMCQLSLGHYFLNTDLHPFEIWYTSEGFAQALVTLQRRYRFDGILVNLPGRPPDIERHIDRMEHDEGRTVIHWRNGGRSILPHDDNAHYYQADGSRYHPRFADIEPDALYYVEAWDVTDITYPTRWAFADEPASADGFFPDYHLDGLWRVRELSGDEVAVHGEVFSPFSQLLELLDYQQALVALMDDPEKCHACLQRLTAGAIDLGRRLLDAGCDAVLISSAFAGAGFISRKDYQEFVLPYERQVVRALHEHRDVPVYTHTCGAIGDRLELMLQTETNGIDTLDPPPLGTVELADAKRLLSGRAFIKGNIDPVNTLLNGTPEAVRADVLRRLSIAAPGGGYILSSACSVPPRVPPEHLEVLTPLACEFAIRGR